MRPTSWPSALTTRGGALPALGRLDEAVALLRGAIALADESGHIDHGLRARNNLLASAFDDMPIGAQLPVLDESVDIARRFGMAGHLALSLHARADTRFTLGLWDGRAPGHGGGRRAAVGARLGKRLGHLAICCARRGDR